MQLNTLKQIDAAIRSVRGRVAQFRTDVQSIAVAIVEHARKPASEGGGAGDVSRAIRLVQAVPAGDQQRQLMYWFQWYGSIGMDLTKDVCKRLPVEAKRSAYVRGFADGYDLDGARTNNWFEPYITVPVKDENGKPVIDEDTGQPKTEYVKAPWFMGPPPEAFNPSTLKDFGEDIVKAAKRLERQLDAKKEVTQPSGKKEMVNVFNLRTEDRQKADEAIAFLKTLGLKIGAAGQAAFLQKEAEHLLKRVDQIHITVQDDGAKDGDAPAEEPAFVERKMGDHSEKPETPPIAESEPEQKAA